MSRMSELAIELTERGASNVASGMDTVSGSAERMGKSVETASKKADTSASRIDGLSSSADEMASKSSVATGALGALSSGFELVGLGPYASGLQAAAMATDFFSGVGDAARLVLESTAIASARAKVATIAHGVASKVTAASQWLLNAAMSANPVMLVVAGVALLVGGFILLYKKSDTFRAIVGKAMDGAKAAVRGVVIGFKALASAVGTVVGFIGRVVGAVVRAYVGYFKAGARLAIAAWKGIQTGVRTVIEWIGDRMATFKTKVGDVWDTIKSKGKAAFDALLAPIQAVIDKVQAFIDKIKGIDFTPWNKDKAGGDLSKGFSGGGVTLGDTVSIQINVSGGGSSSDAEAIMRAIDSRLRGLGKRPVFA